MGAAENQLKAGWLVLYSWFCTEAPGAQEGFLVYSVLQDPASLFAPFLGFVNKHNFITTKYSNKREKEYTCNYGQVMSSLFHKEDWVKCAIKIC